MKVVPVATNHILIELDNGETLEMFDNTLVPGKEIVSLSLTSQSMMLPSYSAVRPIRDISIEILRRP